ncbi:MAG: CDP-glycerol glycerophosphotransferase family protein [Microbacteriaceae bacterium]
MFISLGSFIAAYRLIAPFASPKAGRVLFATDSAKTPKGNLECVLDELRSVNDPDIDIAVSSRANLWSFRGPFETIRLAYRARTSAAIVIDDYFPELYSVNLHPSTAFIQLWHASGAFKKVGFARAGLPGGPRKGSSAHRGYTHAIVSADGVRSSYATAFNMPVGKVKATGVPKTDVYFDKRWVSDSRERVRRELGIPAGARVSLVATTFHGHGQPTAKLGAPHINWAKVADGLPHEYIVVKNHPFTRGIKPNYPKHPRVIDATDRNDLEALLAASDVMVTDFSSVIFDAALLNRPVVYLFANTDDYEANRGFFFDADSYIWGPNANNESELVSAIARPVVDQAVFDAAFARHLSACDGKSTQRVVHDVLLPAARAGR